MTTEDPLARGLAREASQISAEASRTAALVKQTVAELQELVAHWEHQAQARAAETNALALRVAVLETAVNQLRAANSSASSAWSPALGGVPAGDFSARVRLGDRELTAERVDDDTCPGGC